ncbi:MAG: hypothetical protein EBU70_14925, partial [Actinobacteria bacterium]|nr:hypothetical protein [Actinomycetota bacterium]
MASIIGAGDGRLAVVVRSAGRYRCTLRAAGATPADSYGDDDPTGPMASSPRGLLTIPVVAALATTIDLAVPQGVVPIAEGAAARLAAGLPRQVARGDRTYRIELGPVAVIRVRLEPSLVPVPLAATSRVTVERGEFRVSTSLVPARPWNRESFSVDLDPGLVVSGAWAEEGPRSAGSTDPPVRTPLFHERSSVGTASGGGRIRLTLPDSMLGRRSPVVVEAVAAFDRKEGTPVPLVRPLPDEWASGTVLVSLDRVTTFQAVEVEAASIVDPGLGETTASDGIPTVAIEQQSSVGAIRVSVAGRPPEIDTARVTTVDITGGAVTGRAAASVAVRRGVAFELKGRVGPEWLIDSVEIPGEPVEFD